MRKHIQRKAYRQGKNLAFSKDTCLKKKEYSLYLSFVLLQALFPHLPPPLISPTVLLPKSRQRSLPTT